MENRVTILINLLELNEPLINIKNKLSNFSWDSKEELVHLTVNHVLSILHRFLSGELTISELDEWANAIECREDIGYALEQEEILKKIIFDLANPELANPLTDTMVNKWIDMLGENSKPMNNIEIAPFDNLLVYKCSYNPSFVKETIERQKLNGLRIFTYSGEKPINLDFLEEYYFLDYLSITTQIDYDFGFLKKLPQLKKLSLGAYGKKEIDLSNQTNLESLGINWRKNILGIESCINLKRICLVDWKEKNLKPITVLENLQELVIKSASITALVEVNHLLKLEHILLGNCTQLKSLSGLNGLPKLKDIDIISCSKIMDYESLTDLPDLEELAITDCNKVKSINFISNFKKLRKLVLNGNTDIEDGNLLVAKDIAQVICPNRRHYNLRFK